jgi:hypothetical protein
MKKLLVIALFLSLSATLASAELLVTANPLGQGKIAVLGGYLQDQNYLNMSGWTLGTIAGYAGYGIMEGLDAYLQLGSATASGIPAGATASSTGYGASVKYTLLNESPAIPVAVAVGAGYKFINYNFTGNPNMNGNQAQVGLVVSKAMAPFVPYCGVAYRKTTANAADGNSQMDLTAGTAIAWSAQGAVLVEYTAQSITTAGTNANYSSGQIAAAVAYKI